MAAMDLLTDLFRIPAIKLIGKEKILIERLFFVSLYKELITFYEIDNHHNKEVDMSQACVIGNIVKDLLSTDEYSLQGLADYTGYPEDVIYDLASGININPTISLTAKIIELHAIARRELYDALIGKVVERLTVREYS